MISLDKNAIIYGMRLRNPRFKKSIRDEIKPQVKDEKSDIKVPGKDQVKKLWWSKYSPDLKNPKSK